MLASINGLAKGRLERKRKPEVLYVFESWFSEHITHRYIYLRRDHTATDERGYWPCEVPRMTCPVQPKCNDLLAAHLPVPHLTKDSRTFNNNIWQHEIPWQQSCPLTQPIRLTMCLTSNQGCTNPGRLANVATKFWTVVTRFLENVCTPVLKVIRRTEFSLNFSSLKRPDRIWGPQRHIQWVPAFFPAGEGPRAWWPHTSSPKSRMSGAMFLRPLYASITWTWRTVNLPWYHFQNTLRSDLALSVTWRQ